MARKVDVDHPQPIRCCETYNHWHWMNEKRLSMCDRKFRKSGVQHGRILLQGRAAITCLECLAMGRPYE